VPLQRVKPRGQLLEVNLGAISGRFGVGLRRPIAAASQPSRVPLLLPS
jgi:hypothetical protein